MQAGPPQRRLIYENYCSRSKSRGQSKLSIPTFLFLCPFIVLAIPARGNRKSTINNRNHFMYRNLQLRFEDIIQELSDTLYSMALDSRTMSGVSADVRNLRSTASTPSLRSREGSITPMGMGKLDGQGGGNVKVVVRVRGFLPRGMV